MKSIFSRISGPVFLLLFFSLTGIHTVHGQMVQRNLWEGPLDITSIGAPNLIPVYLNGPQAETGKLLADSLITDNVLTRAGSLLNKNQEYTGGSPFLMEAFPATAYCTGDPDIEVCTQGLIQKAPTASCPGNYSGESAMYTKHVGMTYPDFDQDNSTFSSSMAELQLPSCSKIESAYLYWTGNFSGANPAITFMDGPLTTYNGNASVFNVTAVSGVNYVRLKVPGQGYQTVTAVAQHTIINSTAYACRADVTALVKSGGSGQYWVANMLSYPQASTSGSSSGWALVIVYRSPESTPKRISLWDGNETVSSTTTINLSNLLLPSTGSSKSFIGFGALDGEGLNVISPVGVSFQTNGGPLITLNPFLTDQPSKKMYTEIGLPATCNGTANLDVCNKPLMDANWCTVYDNFISSKISTYDPYTDKNGNGITRLPANKNTLGFDIHHAKLPSSAIAPNATMASLTFDGSSDLFHLLFAYMALETSQPKLEVTKFPSVNSASPGTALSYTIRVKNTGKALCSSVNVRDTLDIATTYLGPSSYTRYVNGVPLIGTLTSSHSGNLLNFDINSPIQAGDSFDIVFAVGVKSYAGNTNLWDDLCKRTIYNKAWALYSPSSTDNYLTLSGSNERDCAIGTETLVLVQGFTAPTNDLGPFDICATASINSLDYVKQVLISNGVDPSVIDEFDIRTSSNVRVRPGDFSNVYQNGSDYYLAYRNDPSSGYCQEKYKVDISCSVISSVKDELEQSIIKIYPNPSEGQFTIDLQGRANILSMEITDINGKTVSSKSMDNHGGVIKVSDLSSGIYVAKIVTPVKTFYKKMIVY